MRQYLSSATLQSKVLEFWTLGRPVGAICHGVLVLANPGRNPVTVDPGPLLARTGGYFGAFRDRTPGEAPVAATPGDAIVLAPKADIESARVNARKPFMLLRYHSHGDTEARRTLQRFSPCLRVSVGICACYCAFAPFIDATANVPPNPIVYTALEGTITIEPRSLIASYSMFMARRCIAVGLSR